MLIAEARPPPALLFLVEGINLDNSFHNMQWSATLYMVLSRNLIYSHCKTARIVKGRHSLDSLECKQSCR